MKKRKIQEKYSKSNLEKLIISSNCLKEVIVKMNMRAAGGNFKTLRYYINLYSIDITHFENHRIQQIKLRFLEKQKPLEYYLTENSQINRFHLKKRLVKEGYKKYECEKCGNNGSWNNENLTLQLDHVNGIYNDNRLENIRFLCPNCHSQTNTYAGKKDKSKIKSPIKAKHLKVKSILKTRKVERPSYQELLEDVNLLGYSATGRKYQVSDNAIRKWINHYKKIIEN